MTVTEICKRNFEQKKEKTYCNPERKSCYLLPVCHRPVDSRVPSEIKQWEEDLEEMAKKYSENILKM